MSSIRVKFPVIGSVKVKAHKTEADKFFLKIGKFGGGSESMAKLRGYIPEIETDVTGPRNVGAAVSKTAFVTGAPVAYKALAEIEIANGLAALETRKAKLGDEVGATTDFVSNLDARLAAVATKPTFSVIDGGADGDESEADFGEDEDEDESESDEGSEDEIDDNY
jgi:hypothetical protein